MKTISWRPKEKRKKRRSLYYTTNPSVHTVYIRSISLSPVPAIGFHQVCGVWYPFKTALASQPLARLRMSSCGVSLFTHSEFDTHKYPSTFWGKYKKKKKKNCPQKSLGHHHVDIPSSVEKKTFDVKIVKYIQMYHMRLNIPGEKRKKDFFFLFPMTLCKSIWTGDICNREKKGNLLSYLSYLNWY